MISKLIPLFIAICGVGVCAEEPPEQPKDYYVQMAVLNLFTYKRLYENETDASKKLGTAGDMAFISFNYFVQKEKGLIRWSSSYEKAIRVIYHSMLPELEKENPFMNPCGWEEGAEKPRLKFPKTHRMTLPEYQILIKKFLTFLSQKEGLEHK